ncbi:hypothetical protein AB4140_19715 [Shewanella sp. 10N.286.51.B2]|uniref:hypothetical protein n=1 Tax=unclassified Shewanella TaxID=196818 RepID=UPI0026E36B10|nr:hypothetical protein [Shewanella sp. 6_MG-2023]MDO6620540.1 hypothetical protein [Shewanella sp. 6_MG-2023]
MKHIKTSATLLMLAMLAACGSDDAKSSPENPDIPEIVEPPQTGSQVFDNVWGPDIKWQLEGPITIYIGKEMARTDWVAQSERRHGDIKHGYTVQAADVRKLIPKPLRDDIFNDGQITFAEVLLYVSATRDDFHVEYEWGEDIGAYRFTVWHNEDGSNIEFDTDGKPVGEGDPNWAANWIPDTGEFKRENKYTNFGEAVGTRMEMTVLQDNSGVMLASRSEAYTYRREEMQRTQVERRKADEEKFGDNRATFPRVMVQPVGGEQMVFNDVVVRPHNLRPDIYKKDVMITMADVFMSLHEQGLVEMGFSYWGQISTGANIQHFLVNSVDGVVNQARFAYAIDGYETRYTSDWNHKYGLGNMADSNSAPPATFCDGIGLDGQKTGTPNGLVDEECAEYFGSKGIEIDLTDWHGDKNRHVFPDVWPLYYPTDSVFVMARQLKFAAPESHRVGGDDKYPIYDIDEAIRPLSEEHFGWGVADCGTCHSLGSIHSDGDQGSLGVNPTPVYVMDLAKGVQSYEVLDEADRAVAPYQCAQCHGNNGAPEGHGEVGVCFWCHDNEFQPKNHGSVNKLFPKMYEGGNSPEDMTFHPAKPIIDVPSTDRDAVSVVSGEMYGDPNYLLNILPELKDQNFVYMHGLYSDDMKVRGNSDWTTDPVYPDPYSCMTCHVNPK